MYNIWKFNTKTGEAEWLEKGMSIQNAFDYVSFNMKQLKPNEQLFT